METPTLAYAPVRTCRPWGVATPHGHVGDAAWLSRRLLRHRAPLNHCPLCDMRMPHAMVLDTPLHTDSWGYAPVRTCRPTGVATPHGHVGDAAWLSRHLLPQASRAPQPLPPVRYAHGMPHGGRSQGFAVAYTAAHGPLRPAPTCRPTGVATPHGHVGDAAWLSRRLLRRRAPLNHCPLCDICACLTRWWSTRRCTQTAQHLYAPVRTCRPTGVATPRGHIGDAAWLSRRLLRHRAPLNHCPLCDMRMPHAMVVDTPLHTDRSAPLRTCVHLSTDRGRDPSPHTPMGGGLGVLPAWAARTPASHGPCAQD